jgi:hypothetical protein
MVGSSKPIPFVYTFTQRVRDENQGIAESSRENTRGPARSGRSDTTDGRRRIKKISEGFCANACGTGGTGEEEAQLGEYSS